jgi:hypothetical protein
MLISWRLGAFVAILFRASWPCFGDAGRARSSRLAGPQQDRLDDEIGEVDCNPSAERRSVKADSPFGALHNVVGHDGVLMISMERDVRRFDQSAAKLQEAGIFPTRFPASDGKCDAQLQLSKGCFAKSSDEAQSKCVGGKLINEKSVHEKSGYGCSSTEQAIADSHRRALATALRRKKKWTAILEEDVVPVRPERWDKAFRQAWAMIPKETKIVRLSYCMFPDGHYQTHQEVWKDVGEFLLAKWHWAPNSTYSPSGCTGGYIVHKDIIPEMLAIFPCCCAMDCCLEWDFLNKKADDGHFLTRGMQVLMSMDAWGSTDYARGFMPYDMHQNGVLVQDCRHSESTRDATNSLGEEVEESAHQKPDPEGEHRESPLVTSGFINSWGKGMRHEEAIAKNPYM